MTRRCSRYLPVLTGCLLGLTALLTACAGAPPDPDRVTESFWEAVIEGNRRKTLEWVEVETRRQVALDELPEIAAAEVGRIVIDADSAEVDTRLTVVVPPLEVEPEAGEGTAERIPARPVETRVTTYLTRIDGNWKVDYERTTRQLKTRAEIEEIVGTVRAIGETLSSELNRGVEMLKETLPAIKDDLVQELDRMERELADQLPEIRARLEAFSRQLEEALKAEPPTEKAPAPEESPGQGPDGAPEEPVQT